MKRLHKLLFSLDPQQIKVLKNYVTSFSTRDGNTKFWELAEFTLKQKKAPDLKTVSAKIYNSPPDHRIIRLKNRLYSKVLDSLLIDINTSRDIYEDEVHPIQIRLRKKMILFDLLKYTPLKPTLGMEMITDIISTAKQYEFYPILLDAMYILKWNFGIKKGIDYFNKVNKEIEFFEKCKGYEQRANDLYTYLGQLSTFNSKADRLKVEKFLEKSIEELKQAYIETKVTSVGYFLKTFEMTYLQHNNKIEDAKDVALLMIEFLKENKNVGRKARFGIWYNYISEFEIALGNYSESLSYIMKSREYFVNSPINIAISKKIELDVRILQGDLVNALKLVDELSQTNTNVTGDFRHDIYLYYKGCIHFMMGEYRECARLMNLKFQITKDKLGWEVNIRFMRIMVMVELGKPDEAYKMVDTVAKHIERYQKIADISERDILLLKLFKELAKEGFGFFRPNEKVFHYLLLLKEKGKPQSWEPRSPELVQVHNWAINKYERFVAPGSEEKSKGAKEKLRKKTKGNA